MLRDSREKVKEFSQARDKRPEDAIIYIFEFRHKTNFRQLSEDGIYERFYDGRFTPPIHHILH